MLIVASGGASFYWERCFAERWGNCVSNWYVAAIQPRGYDLAKLMLLRDGFDVYDPFARDIGERQSRLFPGYLFIQCTHIPWQRANRTPGVVGLLPLRRDAITIPIALVDRVHELVEQRQYADDIAIQLGDEVAVTGGAFAGFTGKLIARANKRSLILELIIFGGTRRVNVLATHVAGVTCATLRA